MKTDNTTPMELRKFKKEIRQAIADYMASEGCSCCRSYNHGENKQRIAKLLHIPKYKGGVGYDFSKYQSKL